MALKFSIFLLFCFGFLSLSAQLTFDDNFDSGRLDSAYLSTSNEYVLAPHISMFCRVTGVQDSTPLFKIYDWEGYRLRTDHKMVWSNDGLTDWHFFDNGQKTGSIAYYHFSNNQPFTADTVFISYWYPWSYGQQVSYMAQIAGSSPYLRNDSVRGLSVQGRNIYGYEITDPAWPDCFKKRVVWTGRQHPTEFKQNYVTNGMTNYLLYSTDPVADSLRKYYVFHFYPMINPDGVFQGIGTNVNGVDPNRSWTPGYLTPGGCTETDVMRTTVWNDCQGHVDYSIDIHSNPGHRGLYYYFGLKSGPQAAEAAALVQAIHYWDSLDHNGATIITDTIFSDTYGGTAFTAGNWMNQTMGAVSYTLEPNTLPADTIPRLETLGRSVAKGFYQMINASLPPVTHLAALDPPCAGQDSGAIDLTLSHGLPPVSFLWSNGDTLEDLIGLGAGTYSVVVTDSQGCVVYDTVTLLAPDSISLTLGSTPQQLPAVNGTASVSPTGGTPPYSFQWSDPSGQTDSVASGLSQGWYTVTVTDGNGCQSEDSVLVDALVNANPNPGEPFAWELFPNPIQDFLYAQVHVNGFEKVQIELYDMMGQSLIRESYPVTEGENRIEINLEALPTGVYFLILKEERGSIRCFTKVVKT